ncbi:hypothetical protein BD410DRAFT_760730 [Rickenella mellea]|uniref:Uncharacterized protein n=1 Tax=Rickenella mellea TaxID=50990 RepID=A0A4Y7QMS8_9AGAM|nr:hypothetical protein BD410DRAFT_760730 [Rickenella mellea]
MKFTTSLSALLLLLPVIVSAVPEPESLDLEARQFNNNFRGRQGRQGGFRGGKGGKGGNKGGNAKGGNAGKGGAAAAGGKGGAAASTTAAAAAAASTTAAAAAGGAANATAAAGAAAGGKAANSGDPQSSLTLDPKVVSTGFEQDGQAVPEAGQVPSLTSSNNFINFCLTTNKPLTNGQQVKTGSCNTAPMGVIAATTNMPSSKFTFPKNGDTIAANTNFTITMAIQHIQTGNFVNAQSNYYAAPQQVNGQGDIIGHSHFVIEKLTSLDQTTPTDPGTFTFFKGVNTPAAGGVLSVPVPGGVPAGVYRIASINAAMNHQPVLVAIAQHGSLDDMCYFTATDGGAAAAGGAAAGGAAAGGAAAGGAAAGGKGGAAAASTTAAAAAGGKGGAAAASTAAAKPTAAAKGGAAAAGGKGGAAAGAKGGKGGAAANNKGGKKGGRVRLAREY